MKSKSKTKTTYITKLIVAKPVNVNLYDTVVTYRPGRVLEVIRHKKNFYDVWDHVIVIGHGLNEVVTRDNLKVSHIIETVSTTTTQQCVNKA